MQRISVRNGGVVDPNQASRGVVDELRQRIYPLVSGCMYHTGEHRNAVVIQRMRGVVGSDSPKIPVTREAFSLVNGGNTGTCS